MKVIYFNDFIKNYNTEHIDTDDFTVAINNYINNRYELMSYNGSMTLNPGNTLFLTRDFISNIKSDEPIYYVINDNEYIITDQTRILTFLTTVSPIYLRNKTGKKQVITFKKWFVKLSIMEILSHSIVQDDKHCYHCGKIEIDD